VAAAAKKEQIEAAQNGRPEEEQLPIRQAGEVSPEELWTLYSANEIKVRAMTEQIAARDQALANWNMLGTRLMELLGVDEIDKVLAAVEKLLTNRQARRSQAKNPRRSRIRSAPN